MCMLYLFLFLVPGNLKRKKLFLKLNEEKLKLLKFKKIYIIRRIRSKINYQINYLLEKQLKLKNDILILQREPIIIKNKLLGKQLGEK